MQPLLWAWLLVAPLAVAVFDLMATGRAQTHRHR